MPWKDGFFKRNPAVRNITYGAAFITGMILLALTFGPDETREFARDIAEEMGLVAAEPIMER